MASEVNFSSPFTTDFFELQKNHVSLADYQIVELINSIDLTPVSSEHQDSTIYKKRRVNPRIDEGIASCTKVLNTNKTNSFSSENLTLDPIKESHLTRPSLQIFDHRFIVSVNHFEQRYEIRRITNNKISSAYLYEEFDFEKEQISIDSMRKYAATYQKYWDHIHELKYLNELILIRKDEKPFVDNLNAYYGKQVKYLIKKSKRRY